MTWPALIFSEDLLPDRAPLNGRRWASQLLLRLWLDSSGEDGLDLLAAQPEVVDHLKASLSNQYSSTPIRFCSIKDPNSLVSNGALFVPDPSIGSWASWRQAIGGNSFSLIGQIHTLSTSAVMAMLDSLVFEPVHEWDALICSSTAGKNVVQGLLDDRIEQLKRRCGATKFPKPQLPVIPLPLDEDCFEIDQMTQHEARSSLGLPQDAAVVLWLGRRSLLTKTDPWPAYQVLQGVAEKLKQPVWLIECGPDDTAEQGNHFNSLRKYCSKLHFLRLGGEGPAKESDKKKALLACDVVFSLVDNIQETFGLSVAEAMAASKPVVASDWDGYRDLLRNGIDGFLIPSRWDDIAADVSFSLGWQQKIEISSFPMISGSLAQLVQLDLKAAESAVLTLLSNPSLARAMGKCARARAYELFSPDQVMPRFAGLFEQLKSIRLSSTSEFSIRPPLKLDPVRCFAGFASQQMPFDEILNVYNVVPEEVVEARKPLLDQISAALPDPNSIDQHLLMKRKHC